MRPLEKSLRVVKNATAKCIGWRKNMRKEYDFSKSEEPEYEIEFKRTADADERIQEVIDFLLDPDNFPEEKE